VSEMTLREAAAVIRAYPKLIEDAFERGRRYERALLTGTTQASAHDNPPASEAATTSAAQPAQPLGDSSPRPARRDGLPPSGSATGGKVILKPGDTWVRELPILGEVA
jgi:hypothetical protein